MIGLEIHQRLKWKLFCNCKFENLEPKHKIERMLNLGKSELSEVDLAADLETKKRKKNIYIWNKECLVELDEEPPHLPNKESLEAAVAVAKRFNMHIFNKIKFMRKIVVDGSNTSGFQRTALIAVDGYINLDNKTYGIDTLCLEEESADLVESTSEYNIYNLNRLGISLLEISTSPVIKTGIEAMKVAEYIGLTLRLSKYVERGIGTIRQDLNVSVDGGARVEIKGAQELEMIPIWIDNEIERQKDLLSLLPYLKPVEYNPIEVTSMLKNNQSFIGKKIEKGEKAYIINFPNYEGIFIRKVGKRRYGSELSDYAKLAGVNGIIHSDEASKYGIDIPGSWVMVIASEEKAKEALKYVVWRANMNYIPKETRRALKDGSTEFIRPLPSSARMYPETDIPTITLDLTVQPIDSLDDKLDQLKKELNDELANRLIRNRKLYLYEELKHIDPKVVAITIEDVYTSIRREIQKEPSDDHIRFVLNLYKENKITKKAIKEVLKRILQEKDYSDLIKFDKEKIKELLKQYSKIELLKKYPYNIDPLEIE